MISRKPPPVRRFLLTRAEKDAGAPTTPSRWLTRLTMLVEGAGLGERLRERAAARFGAGDRSSGVATPALKPPAPKPPVQRAAAQACRDAGRALDPRSLCALCEENSELEAARSDRCDAGGARARDRRSTRRWRTFVKLYPAKLPAEARGARRADDVRAGGVRRIAGAARRARVLVAALERVAKWFLEFERERRVNAVNVLAEQHGEMKIRCAGGRLHADARRPIASRCLADDVVAHRRLQDRRIAVVEAGDVGSQSAADAWKRRLRSTAGFPA